MSYNQSRSDKNESTQSRKQGRPSSSSNTHRSSSSGSYTKAGGAPAPAFSSSQTSNRSFKKPGNAQGGPGKTNASVQSSTLDASVESRNNPSAVGNFQNGTSHAASSNIPLQGNYDSSYASRASRQVETPANRSNNASAPKDSATVPPAVNSDANANAPTTPVKASGDPSKAAFPLQFGSLSPGLMNGMQIPRTSSAPPNLDELKRDQARNESTRTMAPAPIPLPKQQQKRDVVAAEKVISVEPHLFPKAKLDAPVLVPPPVQTQKPPVIPYGMAPIPVPFHQPQAAVQFGSNAQIPPQGVPASSLGLPQVQQSIYVQAHIPAQGMIHQGQTLNYPGQMGHQLPPQLSNMGIGIAPHYPPQQGGKFGRKSVVKITDPKTNEELRLADGGQSGMRSHPSVPQSQPNPSFAHINYYPASFDGSNIYFQAPGSVPLQSWPMAPASQSSRYNFTKQQGMPFMDHASINHHSVNKSTNAVHGLSEHINNDNSRDVRIPSSSTVQVTVKPPSAPLLEKVSRQVPSSKDALPHSPKSVTDESTQPGIVVGKPSVPVNVERSLPESEEDKKQEIVVEDRREETMKISNSNVVKVEKKPSPLQQTTPSASLPGETSYEFSQPRISSPVNRQVKLEITSLDPASQDAVARTVNGADDNASISPKTSVEEIPNSVSDHVSTHSEDLAEKKPSDVKEDCGVSSISNNLTSENEVSTSPEAGSGHEEVVSTEEACRVEPLQNEASFENESNNASTSRKFDTVDSEVRMTSKTADEIETNVDLLEKIDNSGEPFRRDIESVAKEKATAELNRTKSSASRAKKKRKDILQKADAAGSSFDLYLAYKGPEEKKEVVTLDVPETTEKPETPKVEKTVTKKSEPEDWEDAVDISTPKLDLPDTEIKKYSRDFLLKFSDRYSDLPDGFETTPDIAEALNCNPADRDAQPSPGRAMDRTNSSSRMDRRGGNMGDDDRWNKSMGQGGNVGYNSSNANFRPGQGGNFGVLRGPRAQAQQYVGGILSGPMAAQGQGGASRNVLDAERWQRGQKGLIPSPQGPVQTMHKAENKYEVRKISSEEEAKQRQLKAILNKLTPQKFDKLFEQVKDVNIDNAETLTGVINQIFDKALMEPTFCEMYANFCFYLAGELPNFVENDKKITFKRLLLNKCQEEFERGEREQEEANKVDEEGEVQQSPEEREEKRLKARRRMLGNIRLIGELYKKKMLTERIMHECIKKLLGHYENPEEEDLEALCKLMSTIGEMIDHLKAKEHMDAYFNCMSLLSDNMKLSSRIRFMLKDAIDLRKNNWQQRRKVEGPKKIDDVHRDAAQERSLQARNLARTPSINQSRRGMSDFGQRGNASMSPTPMGGMRNRTQNIGYEERQVFDARALGPLPQRSMGDDLITLGPQGGLARGMSGFNGFPNAREEHSSRFDQDRSFEKPVSISTSRAPPQPSPKGLSEEILRARSMSAIKEYYSARDEKEVALCIKELNSPNFHPSMISLWVTDSFERKDMERDLLAKLLVNLSQSNDRVLTRSQFMTGLEEILVTLEDAVNDAPRAAEFLGRVVGKAVVEEVVGLEEVGRALREGGEERGRLMDVGVAGDVLGSILDCVRAEKGDARLSQIQVSSSFAFRDFLPPNPYRSKLLEKFV